MLLGLCQLLARHLQERRVRSLRQGALPPLRVALRSMRILRQSALDQGRLERRRHGRSRQGPAELREVRQLRRAPEGGACICRGNHLAPEHRRRVLGPAPQAFQRARAGRAGLLHRAYHGAAELAEVAQHRPPPGARRHFGVDGAGVRGRRGPCRGEGFVRILGKVRPGKLEEGRLARRSLAAAYAVTFEGKTCLITGAAGNLGRAVAASFASAGASLVLIDLDDKVLRSAFGRDDERKLVLRADLLDAASVAQAVAAVRFPGIDVLCNIARGFRMGKPGHETPQNVWELMLDLNAKSLINTARAVVPKMLAAGRGKIVNIGAVAGLAGKANMGAYSAAKSAVIRLTESMSAELRDKGINVNCVLPTVIDTPQNRADMPGADPRRWVAPEALADVILFLASDAARAIHGAAIPVTGLV